MIVVAIVGILALAMSPNFNSSKEQFNLYTTARSCVSDIRYTQQLSMDTKTQHGIYFTTNGYQIKMTKIDGSVVVIKDIEFSGVTYQGIEGTTATDIVFATDGTPSESGKIKLQSTISSNYIYVKVTPQTGEVSETWN